jgi:hypothetical protein
MSSWSWRCWDEEIRRRVKCWVMREKANDYIMVKRDAIACSGLRAAMTLETDAPPFLHRPEHFSQSKISILQERSLMFVSAKNTVTSFVYARQSPGPQGLKIDLAVPSVCQFILPLHLSHGHWWLQSPSHVGSRPWRLSEGMDGTAVFVDAGLLVF